MRVKTSISHCYAIELNNIHFHAGTIAVIQDNLPLPFKVKRVYYLYDVSSGVSRAGNAHKELHHFMVADNGAFDVVLDDGIKKSN